jgi:hypothetical protein
VKEKASACEGSEENSVAWRESGEKMLAAAAA